MTFLILALAIARISRLITTDDITEPLRKWFLYRWPADDTAFGDSEVTDDHLVTGVRLFRINDAWYAVKPHFWSKAITCGWCTSIWVAIIVWALYWFYPVTEVLLTPLALAYVAGFLHVRE